MGGGYISCGEFLGEDKSGSAFEGVLRGIPTILAPDAAATFTKHVATPLLQALYVGEQEFEITPEIVGHLFQPLTTYYAHLDQVLGHPHPYEAPELDRTRGLDMTDAKYGAGLGWQFYCTHDLLRACEISRDTGEPIVISFD
jgi:hypothetical protein